MEADSTTYESNSKNEGNGSSLPFSTSPGNLRFYEELSHRDGPKNLDIELVERLQTLGLLPITVTCPMNKSDCKVICRKARVIDRVQWVCEGCGKRQSIRTGSFFLRAQCSLRQALGMVLAWCEDADCTTAAQYFDIKARVATSIYDRLDDLAVKGQKKLKLGGDGSVVVVEMFPACLTRLSPDTTDQPHVHRVMMLADTNHIPTAYQLHVIKNDLKKQPDSSFNNSLMSEIENAICSYTLPESMVVCGGSMPHIEGTVTLQQLAENCDGDMHDFLSNRIWRQALTLCLACRDICGAGGVASGAGASCAGAVQRYLHTALYRIRFGDGFYQHTLQALANEYIGDGNAQ